MDYRREARRIRARWAGQPPKIHAALRRLNMRADLPIHAVAPGCAALPHCIDISAAIPRFAVESPAIAEKNDWSASVVLGHRGPLARQFADQVALELIGPVLTWSSRRRLLREAQGSGIGLFEANLIIAAVQNRRGTVARAPVAHMLVAKMPSTTLPRTFAVSPWLIAAVVQLVIVALVWRMFS